MPLRFPGLLAPNLSEIGRLSPTAGSLTLKMYGSSEATLTLPESEAEEKGVKIRDWISIYTEEGLAGIFRVTNVSQPLKKQVDLTLLHGIDILSDSVWGEQTDFEGTKHEFLTRLLAQQTQLINGVKPWVLGTCEDTATVKRSINYDRLNTLLEGLIEEGSDFYFTYDQSVFPWRLNYVRIDNQVMSEFRLTRNIRSATITYNDADLCTRLFLTVSSETEEVVPTKKLNPAWVSDTATPSVPRIITENVTVSSVDSRIKMYENTAAQARWGIVVKTADIDTQDDIVNGHFESADAWAASFLARRSAPSVQIQVDGDDLFAITGETWDRSRLARICQVALPAYGETFRERVISITYPDLFKTPPYEPDPTHIQVSLANTLPRFTESLAAAQTEAASASRSSRATARAQTKDEKEITTWSQHVQWQGAALDGSGIMTLYESGIDLDATGGARIYSLENGLQGLYGELIVQSQRIDAKVGSDALQGLLHIDQLSTALGNVMQGPDGGTIGAYVATAINAQTGEGIVQITGDKVNITGLVTMTQLEAVEGKIDTVRSDTITANTYLSAATGKFNTLWVESPGANGSTNTAQVNNAVNGIYEYQPAEEGKIGFQFTTLANPNRQSINFNIADTAYYKSHVGIDAANLTMTEIGAIPYNASDAAVVTGIEAGTADKYYLIAATPKDGDTVYKKFVLPAAAAPAVTTDPKISKKAWASGQIQLDASSDPNDPASVTIALTGGTTGSLIYGNSSEPTTPTGIKFDILEDLGSTTADTGADVVASVTRQAATLKLGTYNNAPAIVANMAGRATVGGQVIQVGVTHLPVTPGTATPNTPTWNSSTHKYAITADGSVSIGSDSMALTRGSLSGDFTPSNAFTYAFNQCYGSIGLSEASQELNPGDSVTIYPKAYSTYDVSINPNAQPQNITTKGITITAKQAATVTPKVSKKSWASGSLTFEGTTASSDPTSAGVALGWVTVPNTSNGNAALSVVDKASPYSSAQPHTVLEKNLTLTCENDAAYLKDGGTTLAKVPNNKTISASIDSIALRTAGGVQYVYDDVERKFTAYLKANGTNVAEKTGEVDIPAASAIEHGKQLVSAVLAETATSAAAPSTLVSGKTYNLYRVVDGTRESAALAAYTVPEASTPSAGSTRYVLNLDPLTLTAADAANISQNNPLIKTTLASYTDGIKEKDRPIEISVNAWEIYQAGINQGMNGVVNVVKGPWSTSSGTSSITFSPSAGNGAEATVELSKVPVENHASDTGTINLMDGSKKITSVSLRLAKSLDGSYVSLYYGMSSGGLNGDIYDAIYGGLNKTELARISVNGTAGGESTVSLLKSIGDITLTEADVGTSVKYPLLTYQDGTKLNDGVNQIPVTVDASAVYLKGQSDGSNVQIEQVRSYGTAATNHKLYTIQPSGNNSVMASAEIYVDVPDGVKSVSKLASALEASTYNGWTAELGALSMSYPYAYCYATGENGKRYNFKIDASEVFNSGMAAGSGVQIETSKNYGTVSSSGLYTITPSQGYGAMQEAKIYVNAPRLYGTYNAGALSGSGTIYPPAGYDGMKAVSYSTVHDISADNPVARIGSTGSRVYIGSVSKSRISSLNNVWIGFTASCGGSSKSFYIQVTD